MNKRTLEKAGIDYISAISKLGGNAIIYEKYLNRFREDNHYMQARKAQEAEDYVTVLSEIHSMKGIVGTLGMSALYEACSTVVRTIRADELDKVEALMDKVGEEYDKVMKIYE